MSDERPIESPSGVTTTITDEQRRATKKARFAQVMDRGYVNDRLNAVNLPAGEHGQWVRDDPMEIDRMAILGYKVADPKKYGKLDMPHGDGTKMKVGDVMFMVCSAEDHELHNEIRQEKFNNTYVKRPDTQNLRKNFKDELEPAGIKLQDDTRAAQTITSPKDI